MTQGLLSLYVLAHCPYAVESILGEMADLDPETDFSGDVVLEELEYLQSLENQAVRLFVSTLKSGDLSGDERAAALACLATYARRVASALHGLGDAASALSQEPGDGCRVLKALETRVRSDERPEHDGLDSVLDLTAARGWARPELPRRGASRAKEGRVDFKSMATVLDTEGMKSHESITAAPARRVQKRIPTGFFGAAATAALTASELRNLESSELEGGEDAQEGLVESRTPSRGSSVVFRPRPIEDEAAEDEVDEQWEEPERQERRYSRIRQRIPTGHPTALRQRSNELKALMDEEEDSQGVVGGLLAEFGRRSLEDLAKTMDDETVRNTEMNS